MPVWKGTMFFARSAQGWSECFYLNFGNAREALRAMVPLAVKRSALLGEGADVTRVEVSQLGGFRVTLATGIAPRPTSGRAVNGEQGLLVRLTSTAGAQDRHYRRTLLLRGCPDNAILRAKDGAATVNPAFLPKLQAFFSVLANGDFLLMVADKDNPWHPVADIILTGDVATDELGNPLPGSSSLGAPLIANVRLADAGYISPTSPLSGKKTRVFLRNVAWTDQKAAKRIKLNGLHSLDGSLPGLVSFRGVPPLAGEYLRGGFVQLRETLFAPITAGEAIGPGVRKCGKALYLRRMNPLQEMDHGDAQERDDEEESEFVSAWGGFTETRTLHNALDLIRFVYEGYDIGDDGLPQCIGIAPIINRPHTWLVGLSGTDLAVNSDTGISADILNGINLPTVFRERVYEAILATVPEGDSLILSGHSLGGMVAQNVLATDIEGRNSVERIITFGSPLTRFQTAGVYYRMFAHPRDLVINVTPLGLACAAMGHPEQTIVPGTTIPDDPTFQHTYYTKNPAMAAWGADGTLVGNGAEIVFKLGPVSRFNAHLG